MADPDTKVTQVVVLGGVVAEVAELDQKGSKGTRRNPAEGTPHLILRS
jgi:hypothetical protein